MISELWRISEKCLTKFAGVAEVMPVTEIGNHFVALENLVGTLCLEVWETQCESAAVETRAARTCHVTQGHFQRAEASSVAMRRVHVQYQIAQLADKSLRHGV